MADVVLRDVGEAAVVLGLVVRAGVVVGLGLRGVGLRGVGGAAGDSSGPVLAVGDGVPVPETGFEGSAACLRRARD